MLKGTNGEQFRRSPYGERGLKYVMLQQSKGRSGRSPYGERGLK